MDLQKQFAAEVAAFLKQADMKPATFGKGAIGDPMFVTDLEKGRAPNLRTIDRVRDFMRKHGAKPQ
jgi:hypothetical protein